MTEAVFQPVIQALPSISVNTAKVNYDAGVMWESSLEVLTLFWSPGVWVIKEHLSFWAVKLFTFKEESQMRGLIPLLS